MSTVAKSDENLIELPKPTPWPMITAFGIALLMMGLVTHFLVSLVGFVVLLRGAIGWWFSVLPVEEHELVPVEYVPEAVAVSAATVDYLHVGTEGHRVRIPAEIHPYSSGIKAGIAGGIAMALVAMLFGLISQGSVWYPVNLFAAGIVSSLAYADIAELRKFSAVGLMVGTVIHGVVSILVGMLYAVLLPMFPRRAGLWSGLVTPLVWSGLIAATLDIVNPIMGARIEWKWFVASQIAFGLVAGFIVSRSESIRTRQTWSLAMRAGLESLGKGDSDEGGKP